MTPAPAWQRAYVALGSNLDNPAAQVRRAVEALAALPQARLAGCSGLYRSVPLAGMQQPDYVNAVAALDTGLTPEELLTRLQAVECSMGRPAQHEHWGPRIIDLDLLVLGDEIRSSPRLTLPHPGMVARNFVLYPLAELAPGLVLPGLGPVASLRARASPQGIERLPD